MVVCEYDKEVCAEVLGWRIPTWQALLLSRVLPSCGGLLVYLVAICFDIGLIFEHIKNGNDTLAMFCLILMVSPALLSTIFTLASPPPGLQTEESAFSINLRKNEILWIINQIMNIVFFPVTAIGRYSYLIFWWIEAVFASKVKDEGRTKEAVSRAREPSAIELYLFLQAFIHSAPHAIVNLLDMMAHVTNPKFEKINMQAVSLIASSLRMASTATVYRRFEREKLCGRKYPWSYNSSKGDSDETDLQETNKGDSDETDFQETTKGDNGKAIYEPIIKRHSSVSQNSYDKAQYHDLIQFSPKNFNKNTKFFNNDTESDTSSNLSELSPPELLDSDDEYIKPISILDKVAPVRRDTQYTIQNVYIPPPPIAPAPRPGSIAIWAEKFVENVESIPAWLSAPPRRKHWDIIHEEPDIPYRIPRSFMRGLEPQDATAALVHFLGWYSFFVARLLSIAAFINFFPFLAIIILFSHYQVMLLFLIVPQASTLRRSFYVFLAFIYLFCLMEFKIRFRHVRVWHVFWIIVCSVEIVMFILLWATIDNRLHYWWRTYAVLVTLVGMLLSYMMFLVYFLILQPRETIVYNK